MHEFRVDMAPPNGWSEEFPSSIQNRKSKIQNRNHPDHSRTMTSQPVMVTQEATVVQKTLSAASSISPPTSSTISSVLTAVGTPAVRMSDAAGQPSLPHRSSGFHPI